MDLQHRINRLYGSHMIPSHWRACVMTHQNLQLNKQRMRAQRMARQHLQNRWDSQENSTFLASQEEAEELAAAMYEVIQRRGFVNLYLQEMTPEQLDRLSLAWMTLRASMSQSRQ